MPRSLDKEKYNKIKNPASLKRIGILKDTIQKLDSPGTRDAYKKQAQANHARWKTEKKEGQSVDKVVQVVEGDWGAVTSGFSKRTGEIYAVLNMANAYGPGGGYLEGMIAQEENMFRRTDCHFSISDEDMDSKEEYIQKMTDLINGKNGLVYLDVDDPRVCIKGPEKLKAGGVVSGYEDLAQEDYFLFFELRSAADDLRRSKPFNKESMRGKIRAQLNTLQKKGIRHVVLSAFGCGAFANPPEEVAKLYKEELEKMPDCFDEVIFAIYNAGYGSNNYQPFYRILQGVSLRSALSTTAVLSYDPHSSFECIIIKWMELLGLLIVAAGLLELIVSGAMAWITHTTVLGISLAMGPSIIGFAGLLLLVMGIIYTCHKMSSEKGYAVIEPASSFVPSHLLEPVKLSLTPVILAKDKGGYPLLHQKQLPTN